MVVTVAALRRCYTYFTKNAINTMKKIPAMIGQTTAGFASLLELLPLKLLRDDLYDDVLDRELLLVAQLISDIKRTKIKSCIIVIESF